ncbi:MAG: M28 family peptidase [Muribaculaceae bacterium]|nr:M28 family peptidase [Muribaculaceae bacterium]
MHWAKFTSVFLICFTLMACAGKKPSGTESSQNEAVTANVPSFCADSAMAFVTAQCGFGPRIPASSEHGKCVQWLQDKMQSFGADVQLQKGTVTDFKGQSLEITNIMASLSPQFNERVLLLAHYDSRPWADADPDPANHSKPVMGANDGASGVSVLMELARVLSRDTLNVGVDILFVDAEDMGDNGDEMSWALGTQYWVKNLPREDYKPVHAILLDMVGATGAQFGFEFFSQQYAPGTVSAVWDAASSAGFSSYFTRRAGGAITDDHVFLCKAGIPCIDIIDLRQGGFFPQWHTAGDVPSVIDPATLRAVGQTLLAFLYSL